jgi:hypothetical protein
MYITLQLLHYNLLKLKNFNNFGETKIRKAINIGKYEISIHEIQNCNNYCQKGMIVSVLSCQYSRYDLIHMYIASKPVNPK